MTLQTNYKTMAHIKDQAQEYLDSAIKTWKGLACDCIANDFTTNRVVQSQDTTAFESRNQHGVNRLLVKSGPTVVKSAGWQLTCTLLLQPALLQYRLTWKQQASELCHIGSISCAICLQNRSIWQSKLSERCQEDNVCIRRDQSGSFSVRLSEHCCDRNVMQIMYHQNRSVWLQQCQSIVTWPMSCSQYNKAVLYWKCTCCSRSIQDSATVILVCTESMRIRFQIRSSCLSDGFA